MFSQSSDEILNLIVDLKVLKRVKPGDKLYRKNKNLSINQRSIFTSLFRYWYSLNRDECLIEIEKICSKTIEVSRGLGSQLSTNDNTYKFHLLELTKEMRQCIPGITNLTETYKNEAYVSGKLELFESMILEQTKENERLLNIDVVNDK